MRPGKLDLTSLGSVGQQEEVERAFAEPDEQVVEDRLRPLGYM